jgi:hypothetical protein
LRATDREAVLARYGLDLEKPLRFCPAAAMVK